jgi:hypothetical protein
MDYDLKHEIKNQFIAKKVVDMLYSEQDDFSTFEAVSDLYHVFFMCMGEIACRSENGPLVYKSLVFAADEYKKDIFSHFKTFSEAVYNSGDVNTIYRKTKESEDSDG